LLENYGL
jgi:hypothetical protein